MIFDKLRNYRRLKSHFLTEIGGQTIAYCYIRKNACSAFKRMILDHSAYDGEWKGSIDHLIRHHTPSTLKQVQAARWRIFVYRDPFDRAASLFRNKMVMQDGAVGLLRSFARKTGRDPADSTFNDFVEGYLIKRNLDPHARSQASHLLPISYNCVSTLDTLRADMGEIFGDELANRYFAAPVNASSPKLSDTPASDLSVRELRERFAASGELPSTAALRTAANDMVIRRVYRSDYELGKEAGRGFPADPAWARAGD